MPWTFETWIKLWERTWTVWWSVAHYYEKKEVSILYLLTASSNLEPVGFLFPISKLIFIHHVFKLLWFRSNLDLSTTFLKTLNPELIPNLAPIPVFLMDLPLGAARRKTTTVVCSFCKHPNTYGAIKKCVFAKTVIIILYNTVLFQSPLKSCMYQNWFEEILLCIKRLLWVSVCFRVWIPTVKRHSLQGVPVN